MRRRWIGLGMLAAAAMVLGGCHSVATMGNQSQYTATLTGSQEVPPVQTSAHGKAMFTVSPDGQSIAYKITVTGIHNVTMAHLHLGSAGENGEHVVWLYPSSPPPKKIAGTYTGVLAQGRITKADFVGPLKGKPMSTLLADIRHGDVYVNVHSTAHPAGDIRGQVRP